MYDTLIGRPSAVQEALAPSRGANGTSPEAAPSADCGVGDWTAGAADSPPPQRRPREPPPPPPKSTVTRPLSVTSIASSSSSSSSS
ncbi:unnamed protein product, partial [Nesidiocoris tenuis]